MTNLSTDILDLFNELDDVDDDLNEESWILAAAIVTARHGINYYCAEACRIAPYTSRLLVLEFLKTH
jgi:hypothetical protein